MRVAALALAALTLALGNTAAAPVDAQLMADGAPPPLLSTFGFFTGSPDQPAAPLIGYTLTTPLFSDYADKRRFIYLPTGTRMTAGADGRIQFPVGAAIIKSFGFGEGAAHRTIETRVLLHRASGWVALPYVWRADGSDADLRLAGARVPITRTAADGTTQTFSYAVPNRNQCMNCHQRNSALLPIGPRVETIEPDAAARALVDGADWRAPRMVRWDDGAASLNDRARAYLDMNCAHCHNPAGSASNSGLFLDWLRPMGEAVGLYKRPVAAGRGSGGLDYVIAPGRANASILPYRMDSIDPGIAMPELGRGTIHAEGLALIRQWIDAMPPSAPPAVAATPNAVSPTTESH